MSRLMRMATHLDSDGFNEHGSNANLSASGQTSDVGYTTLGARAATRIALEGDMALLPHASLAWQHAFGDLTPDAKMDFSGTTGASFTVEGVPVTRDSALLGVGLDLAVTPALQVGLSYAGQLSSDTRNHALVGRLSWSF